MHGTVCKYIGVVSVFLLLGMIGCTDIEAPQLSNDAGVGDGGSSACAELCTGSTPVCDEGSKQCVGCLDDSHCVQPGKNYAGMCGGNNECSYSGAACAAGYVNLDGNDATGCECQITDANDVPDLTGKDTNCDGVGGS